MATDGHSTDEKRPLALRCKGGRYPMRYAAHRSESIRATLDVRDGVVVIRVDDDRHPDRWEEFTVPAEELRRELE